MTSAPGQYALLFVCWISALVTLAIFLESWFALTRRPRLATLRSTDAHGVLSVLVPLGPKVASALRCLGSILDQSYPFIELLIIYDEKDSSLAGLAREFAGLRSQVPVRLIPVGFSIDDETTRIRALDQAQSSVRGSWILVVDSDVTLDPCAVESVLEFSGSEDIMALALSPGIECRSLGQKLLAPSLEWFVRMIAVVDRGREKSTRLSLSAPFLLLHGHTHALINKMNKLPGILNESGWTLWSYRIEGLKTFQGDGSGWIAREATIRAIMSSLNTGPLSVGRVLAFVLGSAVISIVSVIGILFGTFAGQGGFASMGILYFSAFSYSLMATSYFCYSRRLGAAAWFAPFWFFSHAMALLLTLFELQRSVPDLPGVTPARHHKPDTQIFSERK